MSDSKIPGEILEQLSAELSFAEAADEAVEICQRVRHQRKEELAAAEEALDRADGSLAAAERASDLANNKLRALLRANGVVRTADGFALAPEAFKTGAESAVIDTGYGLAPPAELRLGGRAPGLYVDGQGPL